MPCGLSQVGLSMGLLVYLFEREKGDRVFKAFKVSKDYITRLLVPLCLLKEHTMYLDIFIGIVLIFALVRGLMNGFIKELASTIGFLVGLFVAATCYETLGEYLTVDGSEVNMFTSIVAFLLLWIIVPIIFGLLATLLTKALDLTALGIANRIGGGLLSVVKFVVLISCLLNVMMSLRILNNDRTEGSILFEPVVSITQFAIQRASDYTPELIEMADTIFINRESNA